MKKTFISLAITLTAILMLFNVSQSRYFEKESETTRRCLTNIEIDTVAVCKQITPLEEFGQHIEQMCREGRRAEIDDYVISETISLEEAALLAEKEPDLKYMNGYLNLFDKVCILSADINNDGIEDIIEYAPAQDRYDMKGEISNRIYIYLGNENGEYTLAYSQPVFDQRAENDDIIQVLLYEDEIYLLFCDQYDQYKMAIYWLVEGIPCGEFELEYQCVDINVEVIKNKDGIMNSEILNKSMDIYHNTNLSHCSYCRYFDSLNYGSAETLITDEKHIDELKDKYGKEEMSELSRLLEGYEDTWLWMLPNAEKAFISDINNDGVVEEYIKQTSSAWICDSNVIETGQGRRYSILFGNGEWKCNVRHGGKNRLFYYMETGKEKTDFMKLCGLDIWADELIPQHFFVDETPQGNVTYIVYQDISEFEQKIEGYFIDKDTYEHVVSVRYTPVLEFSSNYEFGESKGVNYAIYRTEDYRSVRIAWKDEKEALKEQINQNIRLMIEKKIADVEEKEYSFVHLGYWPIKATDEILILDYSIVYDITCENKWNRKETKIFSIEVNFVTGECREIYRKRIKGTAGNSG